MAKHTWRFRLKRNFLRRAISCVTSILFLLNSILPYTLVGLAYAEEATPSATVASAVEPTPSATPSATPEPTIEVTPTETPPPTPTPTVEPTPEITPEATPSATPTVTPEPTSEPTIEVTPTVSIESASLSQVKTPLRQAGDLQKFSKKLTTNKNYVEGEVIVKFKQNKIDVKSFFGKAQSFVFEKRFALSKKDEIRSANIQVFKSDKSTEDLVEELKADFSVEYAEPNYIRPWSSTTPNDTSFSSQWALNNSSVLSADVSAPEAWDISKGNNDVIVGVLDSGIAYNHPDLINNMWDGTSCKNENNVSTTCPNHGWDFATLDSNPIDDNGHGTHVAGIIGAQGNNSKGISGMNWNVKLMALKVGDYRGAIVGDVVDAINFAINNNVKVLNASFGGGTYSQAEYDAINTFKAAGGIFVAAAGNNSANNDSSHFYPSDYPLDNIISVAATDQNDNIASFSNYGSSSVDVGAPGVDIYSTVAETIIFNENFETITTPNIPNDWVKSGTNNKWSTYNFGSDKVLYGQVPSYPYDNGVDSYITSPNINLSNSTNGSHFNFKTQCDTEYDLNYWTDFMALEFSNDNGLSFTQMMQWDEAYLDSDTNPSGSAFYSFDDLKIPDQYLTSSFKFRLRWHTDGSINNFDGCYVDNIKITKYTDGSEEKYDRYSGTSMAAPHVAGLAALIEGYNPSLTAAEVKNIILTTGDSVSSLEGKTVTGKRINAFAALQASTPASPAKAITSFTISGQVDSTLIDETAHTIGLTMPFGTNVTALVPTIVTTGSSVSPLSGIPNNFTNPTTYTVTAADSTTQTYTVTITVAPDPIATAFDTVAAALVSQHIANNLNDVTSANVASFSSLYFEKSIGGHPVGKLTFTNALNLSDSATQTFLQNLGSSLDQNNGRIALDVSTATALAGKGATLEMYGITSASESNLIVRDDNGNIIDESGVVSNFIYDPETDTVSFDAAHFTQFDIDTTPPEISYHGAETAEATSPSGATVTYTAPNATDIIDGIGTATCSPESGSTFALGSTTVTCNKTDTAGNAATPTTFTVNVQDTIKPTNVTVSDLGMLTNNSHLVFTWPASSDNGSGVSYYNFYLNTANSHSTPVPLINGVNIGNVTTYTLSDSQAALLSNGATYYAKVRAVDNVGLSQGSAGNWSDGITLDTVAPTVNITSPVTGNTVNGTKIITFTDNENTAPQCSINNSTFVPCVSGVTTLHDITDFDALAEGNFTLYLKDTDSATNTGATNQINIIKDTTAPTLSSVGISSNNTTTTLAKVGDTVTLHFFSNEPIKPPTVFIAGHQLNEAGVSNNVPTNGNEWFASYQMASGDSEGQVSFSISYVDAVNNNGSTVTGTTDNSSVTFDNTKPVIASHPDITAIATSVNGAIVNFDSPTATDNVDANSLASCSPTSGSLFPMGNTTVNCSKTDVAGNSALPTRFTVSVTQNPPVLDPIGNKSVNEFSTLSFTVSATDVDDSELTFTTGALPPNASFDALTKTFTFTPDETQGGTTSNVTFSVSDGEESDSEAITISVNETNSEPIAQNGSDTAIEDNSIEITLSAIDSDIPTDTLTYSILSNPSNGSLGSVIGNHVTYTPNANFHGPDSFTFTADDNTSSSLSTALGFGSFVLSSVPNNSATVSITVTPVNDYPTAVSDSGSTNEDTNFSIAKSVLLGNDTDTEGDTLSLTAVSNPTHGTVSISGDNIIFFPTANYFGSASFEYTISDGNLNAIGTVSITVNPINDTPTVDAQTVTTEEDSSITINLVGHDVDGDNLTYLIVSDVSNGTLEEIIGNQFSYTPNPDYTGPDSFEFTVNDGHTDSFSALVTITVAPFNDPPVLSSIGDQSVNELGELTFTAIANDPEESVLTYSLDGNPLGSAINSSTGVFNWIPTENQGPGNYTFSVAVSDGSKTSSEEITVTVNEVNVAPVVNGVSVSTNEDTEKVITLDAADSDLPTQTLTYSKVSDPSHGSISIIGNQATYTPTDNYNGPDSFTYKASDGAADSNVATVSIAIAAVGDLTTLSLIGNKTVDELTTLSFTATATDPDNSITYSLTNAPTGATINSSTGVFSFTPTEAQGPGTYTFTIHATDGTSSDSETITITVNEVNVTPIVNDVSISTNEDTTKNIMLTATDSDLPGQEINYSLVTNPAHGTLDTITDGKINYTPFANYNGPDSFMYKASDGTADSNTATVNITIISVNDLPVASDGTVSTGEDVAKVITLTATDSDVPVQTLTYSVVANPSHGVLSAASGNQITYTPNDHYSGTDYLTFKASDGTDDSTTATITITVIANPNSPLITSVATDNVINNNEKTSIHIVGTSQSDTLVTVTLSDSLNTITGTQQLASGAVSYDISLNGTTLSDGTITITANSTNSYSRSSANTTTTALLDTISPNVSRLGDNLSDVELSVGDTDLVFSEDLSTSSKTVVQNSLIAGADKSLVLSWSGETLTITVEEITKFANDVIVSVSDIAGNISNGLLIIDSSLAETQTTPETSEDGSGTATANSDTPQVVITNPDQEVTVTVDGDTDATLDVSSFITDGSGVLPKITIESDTADIAIPGNTTITSEDTSWDGVIAAPTVTTVILPEVSGETTTLGSAIEIGFAEAKLTFDHAVRILLPGQAGKRVGYSRPGTDFTEITNICTTDNQTVGDALAAGSECKVDVGADLVIWTKHFTKFASYTQTTNNSNSNNNSTSNNGGSSSSSTPVCGDSKPGSAPRLLSAIAGTNSVTLTWTAASAPTTYYLVTYGTKSGLQQYGNPNVGPTGTTSYTIKGLSGNTRYYFRVRSGNGCMPGDFSNELSATANGETLSNELADGFTPGVLGTETSSVGEVLGEASNSAILIEDQELGSRGDKGYSDTSKRNSTSYLILIVALLFAGYLIYTKRRKFD